MGGAPDEAVVDLRRRSLPVISAKRWFLAIAVVAVAALAGRGAYLRTRPRAS